MKIYFHCISAPIGIFFFIKTIRTQIYIFQLLKKRVLAQRMLRIHYSNEKECYNFNLDSKYGLIFLNSQRAQYTNSSFYENSSALKVLLTQTFYFLNWLARRRFFILGNQVFLWCNRNPYEFELLKVFLLV